MDKKTIKKEIFSIILPIIMENVFQVSAGIITVAMIGRLSPTDISAQGICMRITETLNALFRGVAIGATVYIARSYGEGNMKKCFTVFKQGMITAVPLAILFAVIIFSFPQTFLSMLTSEQKLLEIGGTYLMFTVCGLPFVTTMALVTSAFQGHGNTKTPMMIAMLVNVCNIVLGYVLIFGIFNFKGIGINGAAIALTISQAIGAITGLTLLFNEKFNIFSKEQLGEKLFSFDMYYIKEIYTTGVPAAMESFFWQFSAIIMSKVILSYGEISFSAYQIGIQAESITEMPALGFGIAATALSAKAIGMRDDFLFKNYFKEQVKLCVAMSVVTSLMLILLPSLFMSAMTPNKEIQAVGAVYVFVMGFVQIPQNLSRILNGTLRAVGNKNAPMIISFIGIWIIRIPLALLCTYVFKFDILAIWLCIAFDQFIRILISYMVFKKRNVLKYVEMM